MPEENSVPPSRFIRTFQTDLAKVQGNEPAGPVALPEPAKVAPQVPTTPPVEQPAPPPQAPPPPAPFSPPAPQVTVAAPVALTPPSLVPPPLAPLPVPPLPVQKPVPPPAAVLPAQPTPAVPVLKPVPASPATSAPLPQIPQMPKPLPPPPPRPVPPPPAPASIPRLPTPAFQPPPPKPVPAPAPVTPPAFVRKPALPVVVPPPVPNPLPPPPLPPPPPPIQVEPPAPQLPIPNEEPRPEPLHTFKTDFTALFKHRKASVATLIAAQQDEQRSAPELYSKQKNPRTLAYVIIGVVLLVCGIVAALYAYGAYLTKHMPVVLAPSAPAPIFVDERVQISGNGAALLAAIVQSVGNPIASGHVRLLYTAESLSGTSTVFAALGLPAPGRVLRNLKTEGAMAGVVSAGGAQSPFFILPVSSYGETFAGLLSWETSMKSDLAALFPAFLPLPVAATTASTTPPKKGTKAATTTPPAPVYIPGFRDEVIANHDARVYRDDANRVVLVYGYWNQSTFVLARDVASFTEILQRLATSRTE